MKGVHIIMKQEFRIASFTAVRTPFISLGELSVSEMLFLNCPNNNKSFDKECLLFPLPSSPVSVSVY